MFERTKAVRDIFYLNVLIFLFGFVILFLGIDISRWFAAFTYKGDQFELYQLVTYQFLHGGFLHILFNMLVFLSFGPSVENYLGTKKFVYFYLISGIASALFFMLLMPSETPPLVGASGSIYGIMMMFTILYPNQKVSLMFIPYGIKAKYIIGGMFLFEVFSAFSDSVGNVAHWGHVGGGLCGMALILINKYITKR